MAHVTDMRQVSSFGILALVAILITFLVAQL